MKSQIIFLPGPQKVRNREIKWNAVFHRSEIASENLINLNSKISNYVDFEKTISFSLSATETFDIFCNSLKNQYKNVSLIHTGYWSENLNKVFTKNNLKVIKYENIFDYSENELFNIFKKDKSEIFFSVLCESSNAKIYDFKVIYKVLNKLNKKLFIDAVSYPIYLNIENNSISNCDFLLLTSSKNFSSFPGLSFISFKNQEYISKYFDIKNYLSIDLYDNFNKIGQMPHTYNAILPLQVLNNLNYIRKNKDIIYKKNLNKINYFYKKLQSKSFKINNDFCTENSNIIMLKIINLNLNSKNVLKFLSEKNIMAGNDLNQTNEIRICISLETSKKEIKKLIKNLNKIEKNTEKNN